MISQTIQFKDIGVYYNLYKNPEKETILFLHPYGSSGLLFDNQITFFKREYQLLCIDLPGHGKSGVSKNVSFENGPEIIKVILDELNISKCHIVSVSEGSIVAQGFAHIFSEKVQSLVVVGGFSIYHDSFKAIRSEMRVTRLKNMFKWAFSFGGYKNHYIDTSAFTPQGKEKFTKTMLGFKRKSALSRLRVKRFYKLGKQTHFYPTYAVCGNNDLEVMKDACIQYEQKVPMTTSEGYINCKRIVFLDNPRQFNERVLTFLHSVEQIEKNYGRRS